MIEKIISKTIINNKPEEYEALANIILSSPIDIYSYDKVQTELEFIVKDNKKKLKKDNYAFFYNLKTVVIGSKNYKIPSLNILIKFLNEQHDKAMVSLLLAEALDQVILFYIGNKNGK